MKYISIAALVAASSIQANAHDITQHTASINNNGLGIAYDYSYMNMKGNRVGKDNISTDDIIMQGYMEAPTKMTSQQHNLEINYTMYPNAMYSVSVPYIQKDMDSVDMGGMGMKMKSRGVGDVKVQAAYSVLQTPEHNVDVYFGLSVPTGSVEKREKGMKLPYMMQLGTGTYDPIAGAAYKFTYNDVTLGVSGGAVVRTGENDEGYRFGNQYNASIGAGYKVNEYISAGVRLDGTSTKDIEGDDDDLNPMMSPANDANLQSGRNVDAVVSVTLSAPDGMLAGTSLSGEFGTSVYQDLDGPQLESDYYGMVRVAQNIGH